MSRVFYRVVDAEYEFPGRYSTEEHYTSIKCRYSEVFPFLQLAVGMASLTSARLNTFLEIIWRYADSFDEILNAAVADDTPVYLAELVSEVEESPTIQIPFRTFKLYIQDCIQISKTGVNFDRAAVGLVWEYLWEFERETAFPQCFPRHKSIMLWRNEREARTFMNSERRDYMHMRVVKVLLPDEANVQSFDMSWLNDVSPRTDVRGALEVAKQYWSGLSTYHPIWEVLYVGEYEIQEL